MKQSNYNIFVPNNNFTIIYNSFTDRFLGLSNKIADTVKKLTRFDDFYLDHKKLCDTLKSTGMIIDDDFDELSEIRRKHRNALIGNEDLYIMIYPTQDCNLKCWYCYESHVQNSIMNESVMEQTFQAIKSKVESNKIKSLLIGYFGGEPLTDFYNLAYPLSLKLKKMAEDRGIKFSTFFVTNASLIDEKMISYLAEINPLFQITLDGTKEKHNTVRIWKKDNKGTYDTIINALKLITSGINNQFSDDPVVTIRLNYDNQTLKDIDELIKDLKEIDRNKVVVHFERVWQTRHMIDEEQRELLFEAIQKFVNEGFIVKHGVFKKKSISCPTDSHDFMIINYNGKIYKCNGRTLTPETSEGEILTDGTIKWNEARLKQRFSKISFENETCLKCKMLPMCMGPCSQKLMEEGNFCRNICSLNSIDLTLDDYLRMEFEMRYLLQKQ